MNNRIQAILNKLSELVTTLTNKQDKLVGSGTGQNVKTINEQNILGTGNINIEGFSGDYDDLTNKPTIPTVPTNVSSFNNDSGYITDAYHDDTKQDVATAFDGNYNSLSNKPSIPSKTSDLQNDSDYVTSNYHDSTKQDVLTAGDNIVISNNVISTQGGGLSVTDTDNDTTYPLEIKLIDGKPVIEY